MGEVKSLHDLVFLGIKLHKKKLPKGFIVSVKVEAKDREAIRRDLINITDIHPDYIETKYSCKLNYYDFKLLGIHFNVF